MENFEDRFMEVQTGLISLCLELTERKVDKIFAYASIEKKSLMFNAFFEKDGKILTANQVNSDARTVMDFLKTGTMDLDKIRKLCAQNGTRTPTEIKMYYDVASSKFNADYKYTEVCSAKTGLSSGEVFTQWYEWTKADYENQLNQFALKEDGSQL